MTDRELDPGALGSIMGVDATEAARVEVGDCSRRAEIARLARAQRRDAAATRAGKVIRECWRTSQYGLRGGALLCDANITPAERRGSDSPLARVAEVIVESVKIA